MSKLRDMKNKGQLQKVESKPWLCQELFPELKWYHKLWNRIVVGVVVIKDKVKRILYD